MSYDLDFWKYKEGVYLDHQQVYEACSDGQRVEGLEDLPVEEILERIAAAFPGWTRQGAASFERPGGGAFEVMTTPQFVRVDCHGLGGEDMNRFIDLLDEYGCPLYDPQIAERFDGGAPS